MEKNHKMLVLIGFETLDYDYPIDNYDVIVDGGDSMVDIERIRQSLKRCIEAANASDEDFYYEDIVYDTLEKTGYQWDWVDSRGIPQCDDGLARVMERW